MYTELLTMDLKCQFNYFYLKFTQPVNFRMEKVFNSSLRIHWIIKISLKVGFDMKSLSRASIASTANTNTYICTLTPLLSSIN